MGVRQDWLDEPAIDEPSDAEIRKLLRAAWPAFEVFTERRYFEQLPQRRLLAWEGTVLYGHYERIGFARTDNVVRWLKIHEHESPGLAEEPAGALMVKAPGSRPWSRGTVDLLGRLF